jgi:hypothetical protein
MRPRTPWTTQQVVSAMIPRFQAGALSAVGGSNPPRSASVPTFSNSSQFSNLRFRVFRLTTGQ